MILIPALLFSIHAASADSTITHVTVYNDRAEITRSQSAFCRSGLATAVFSGLPAGIITQTLRAESNSGSVIGTSFDVRNIDGKYDKRVGPLLAKQETLSTELQGLSNQEQSIQDQLRLQKQYFNVFAEQLAVDIQLKPNTSLWTSTLDQLHQQRSKNHEAIGKIAQKKRKTKQELELVTRKLQKLNTIPKTQAIDATVQVKCTKNPVVSLAYTTPQASWVPEYDVSFSRLNREKRQVVLTMSANISQSTGEDWEDVKIVLSTARPSLGSEAPYPADLWVDGKAHNEQKKLVQGTEDRSSLAKGKQQKSSSLVSEDGQSYAIHLPHKSTVLSDGNPSWIPIDRHKTSAIIKWVSVPRLSPDVFETAVFNNPAPYPLVAKPFGLIVEGTRLGKHQHRGTAPGEQIELSLGIDPQLQISRATLVEQKQNRKLAIQQHMKRGYQVVLTNNGGESRNVEVRESIPVSKNEAVMIEFKANQSTPTSKNDRYQGFLYWDVNLEPSESTKIKYYYDIHLPDNWITE